MCTVRYEETNVYTPNPPGPQPQLTVELKAKLVDAASKVLVPNQIAAKCRVPKSNLYRWLAYGERDAEAGISSIYAQMWEEVREAQSNVAEELLNKLKTHPKNYGALTFILTKCFKEDFEDLPEDVKNMVDVFIKVIKPLMDKGEIIHGREKTEEMDSESNQA